MKTKEPEQKYSAPALEKGLDIIELLARSNSSLTLAEIGRALSRSKGELFRMVLVLSQRGYIQKDEQTDGYHLTDHLLNLGSRSLRFASLLEHALPVMRSLSGRVSQSCHLAVLSGAEAVVIARIEDPDFLGFSVRVGYRHSVTQMGSGCAILAWMDPASREEIFKAVSELGAAKARKAFVRELETHRSKGWVQRASTVTDGVTDLSVPILSPASHEVFAALSVPYIAKRGHTVSIEEVAENLVVAGKEITRLMSVNSGF